MSKTKDRPPQRMDLQSADGEQLNLDALYKIMPSCFTETRDEDGTPAKTCV